MKCMVCGRELPNQVNMCPYCGARIVDEEDEDESFFQSVVITKVPALYTDSDFDDYDYRIILTRKRTGKVFDIKELPAIVGRSSKCDIVIPDNPKISRKHLRISINKNNHIIAEDLHTTNHSYLNEKQIVEAVRLPETAELLLADEIFYLECMFNSAVFFD